MCIILLSVSDRGLSADMTRQIVSIYPKKVLLCIWWGQKRIVYELLREKQTINSETFGSQLNELKRAIGQKQPELANRKGIVFHQDIS